MTSDPGSLTKEEEGEREGAMLVVTCTSRVPPRPLVGRQG